jgi:hypothetical protein
LQCCTRSFTLRTGSLADTDTTDGVRPSSDTGAKDAAGSKARSLLLCFSSSSDGICSSIV